MRDSLRGVEWYAIIAIVLLITAVALAVWVPALSTLAMVLTGAAIVSALFSYRT